MLPLLLEQAAAGMAAAARLAVAPDSVRIARTPRRTIRRDGRTTLYRYSGSGRSRRPAVLLVYALINRPTILDLLPEVSVVETLLRGGLDVFLLDWGVPAPSARDEGLERHVLGYLDGAVDTVRALTGAKPALAGYCMGGTLCALYAALRSAKTRRLAVMTAPFAGRIAEGVLHCASRPEWFDVDAFVGRENVPAELLNAGFVWLRPVENLFGKYVRYFEKRGDPAFEELFLAMEKWLREGIPLPNRIYREFVKGVYQQNALLGDGLRVGPERARLEDIRCPVLAVTADQDHLVPSASTLALLERVGSKEKKSLRFAGGHVGLAVSRGAHRDVWPEVAKWLR